MFDTLGEYYIWVHDRYRAASEELSVGEFESKDELMGKSIRGLLEHVLYVTRYSFGRDGSEPMAEDDFLEYSEMIMETDKEELLKQWRELDLHMKKQLSGIELGKRMMMIPLTGEDPIELTQEEYYLIFTDHMTFHRGQFLTALKHLGKPGISSDLYYYMLEKNSKARM